MVRDQKNFGNRCSNDYINVFMIENGIQHIWSDFYIPFKDSASTLLFDFIAYALALEENIAAFLSTFV